MVAEADPLISEGLALSLHNEPHLLAYPSTDAGEALERCRKLKPSVLLIDEALLERLDMRRLAGESALVLAPRPDPERLLRHLRLGCAGSVTRQDDLATLRRAVAAVAAGQLWAPRALLARLVRELHPGGAGVRSLTARQQEILGLLECGLHRDAIAERLFLSPETVRWHIRRLRVLRNGHGTGGGWYPHPAAAENGGQNQLA